MFRSWRPPGRFGGAQADGGLSSGQRRQVGSASGDLLRGGLPATGMMGRAHSGHRHRDELLVGGWAHRDAHVNHEVRANDKKNKTFASKH